MSSSTLMFLGCVAVAAPAWGADEANQTTSPTETKFYRLRGAYDSTEFTNNPKLAYADGTVIKWNTLQADDATALWVFTPGSADGKYKMRNAYEGLYQQTRTSNSQNFMLGTTETEVTIHQIGTTNQVYITNTFAMHCADWSGASGNVVSWQTTATANSASAWYIELVEDDDAAITALKNHYISAISHLSSANQAKFADLVDIIDNSSSSANEILNAYKAIEARMPEVLNVVQISDESMLQTGGKYAIGVVGTNATAWAPINPLCYRADASGNTFSFESKPNLDFSSDFFWTVKLTSDYTCDNSHAAHNGPHKVLQLTKDVNGTTKAIKPIDGSQSVKNLAATSDNQTYFEFVPITLAAFPNETLFQFHFDPNSTTHFKRLHAVVPNGSLGYFSKGATEWRTEDVGSGAGQNDSWSSLHRVYLVIDSDDLSSAAQVLWKAFKEEECANSESEQYIEEVNALPVPDVSAYTNAATFIDDLRHEFNKELVDLTDGDYSATVTPASVTYNSGATAWNHTLTDTKGAFVKIISHSGTTASLASNMKKLNNTTFDFRNGAAKRSRYEIQCFNPALSIIGVTFNVSSTATTEYVTVDGKDYHITSEPTKIIAMTPVIEFHGNNQEVRVTDLKVKFHHTSKVSAYPTESGWYSILSTHNLDAYAGKWAVNLEKDVKQSDTNYYSLAVSDNFSSAPASNLIYIEVNGNNRYVKSSNGHYVNENGISSRTRGNNTRFRGYDTSNCTMQVGAYWNSYIPTVDGVTYNLIGQAGGAEVNRWAVFKENPEELYDIWTVNITGAPNASAIQDDVRVQCTHAQNKGLSRVFNHGNFFITRGSTVTANNFVADRFADGSLNPVVTVDAATKTVNVAYLNKEQFVATYYPKVEEGYAAYRNVGLFDAEAIDAVVNAHKASVDAAAGDDEYVVADEVAAMDAAVAAASFTAGYKQIRNSAVGKLAQFRNLQHSTLYMSVAPVSAGSASYRAVGVTDKASDNTLWQIVSANAEQGTVYLKNYGTGLWMQNHNRTTSNNGEGNVPVAAENPVAFEIEAIMNGSGAYVIGFKDTTSSNYKYLHQTTNNGSRVVKWNSPAGSNASGWVAMLAEDDELSSAFTVGYEKAEVTGQLMVLSHPDGVALQDSYFNEHHTIVIRKAADNMRMAQAREGEDTPAADEILITPDKLMQVENTVAFPINENGVLEEGQRYDVTIPAGLLRIGNNKISKADSRTFTYSDEQTTGIREVEKSGDAKVIYDLMGRRLPAPVKGLNIINGKKILVK